MKIGHLRSASFFGGPERAILGQCLNMPGPAFHCLSFTRAGLENPFLERCRDLDVAATPIPEWGPGDPRAVFKLRAATRRLDLDLLVSHDYQAHVFANLALSGQKTAHVRHFRGFTWEDRKVRLYNAIDAWCLRRMKRIITVSRRSAEILGEMGVAREKIIVVPNAIEDHKLAPADFHRARDPEAPLLFISAGRLSYEKGYDVLLEAMALVTGDRPHHVDVYGEGPEQTRLEKQAHDLGVADRITFRGFIDDVLPALRKADCMVLPSRTEGMPNILLEAWSQKLGSVATAVGGIPEMITERESGLICPPEDPAALASCMDEVLNDPGIALTCGDGGYETVRHRYSYSVQSQLLAEVYDAALRDGDS